MSYATLFTLHLCLLYSFIPSLFWKKIQKERETGWNNVGNGMKDGRILSDNEKCQNMMD